MQKKLFIDHYCPWCKKIRQIKRDKIPNSLVKRRQNKTEYFEKVCDRCKDDFKRSKGAVVSRDDVRGMDRTVQKQQQEDNIPKVVSSTVFKASEEETPLIDEETKMTISESKTSSNKPERPEASIEKEEHVVETVVGPSKVIEPKPEHTDPTVNYGIRWGVIGTGHAGSRIAEKFAQCGYPTCCINTAKQDLDHIQLPESNKYLMDFALGGVGKDMGLGSQAIKMYRKQVTSLINATFGDEVDMVIVTVGLGGGSGAGSLRELIDILKERRIPIVLLVTLPMGSEGATTKTNAIRALDELAQLSKKEIINGLIVVDNSKIEVLYPNVASSSLWSVANTEIVDVLNTLNTVSALGTAHTVFDPMDFAKIFTTGNCTVYGKIKIPHYMEPSALADAILENVTTNVLAEGFDLSQTIRAGVILIAPPDVLEQIPSINVNYAFRALNDIVGSADVFRGVYAINRGLESSAEVGDYVTMYCIFSGIGLPRDRVEALIKESNIQISELDKKMEDKSVMNVFKEAKTIQTEEEQYQAIRQSGTPVGQMMRKRVRRARG